MTQCVFCSIVRGQSKAVKVYEDQNTLAIMDIRPITKGHILVFPKKHAELLKDLDTHNTGEMMVIGRMMGKALMNSKFDVKGINYLLSDGAAAGQDVFHVHLHVIPRYKNDGFHFNMPEGYEDEKSMDEIESAAVKVRAGLE